MIQILLIPVHLLWHESASRHEYWRVLNIFPRRAVAIIQNMALQHHDFELRLRDAERLRLFVQSRLSDQEALDASLKEAQLSSRRWELEAKEAMERAVQAETEKDTSRNEAAISQLQIDASSGARAQVEAELAHVRDVLVAAEDTRLKADSEREAAQQALVSAEEACQKVDKENSHLMDERLSLLMELEVTRGDFATFWNKASVEKTAMEAEFDASSDVIFNYGYGCFVFARNICGSEPLIPIGMPDTLTSLTPEFFVNPRCPSSSSSVFPLVEPIETFEKYLSAKDLPASKGGVDILSGSLARSDKEPNVVVEG